MKIVDIYENMKDLIRRIIKEQTENPEKKGIPAKAAAQILKES